MARRTSEEIARDLESKAKRIRDEMSRKQAVERSVVARRADEAARAVRKLAGTVGEGDERYKRVLEIADELDGIRRGEHAPK